MGLSIIPLVYRGGGISCAKVSVAGMYVNENNPSEHIELHPDSVFEAKEYGYGISGEWEVEEDMLILHYTFMGMSMPTRADIKGSKIIDEDSEVWVKE